MKPGSSERCKARNPEATHRCRRHKGHDGKHTAPAGKGQVEW